MLLLYNNNCLQAPLRHQPCLCHPASSGKLAVPWLILELMVMGMLVQSHMHTTTPFPWLPAMFDKLLRLMPCVLAMFAGSAGCSRGKGGSTGQGAGADAGGHNWAGVRGHGHDEEHQSHPLCQADREPAGLQSPVPGGGRLQGQDCCL